MSAANTSHVAMGGVGDEVGDSIAVKMEVMDNSWIECLRVNGAVGGLPYAGKGVVVYLVW